MTSLWGEGLFAKYYLGRRIELRRNSLVYEVVLRLGRTRTTFVLWRNKY